MPTCAEHGLWPVCSAHRPILARHLAAARHRLPSSWRPLARQLVRRQAFLRFCAPPVFYREDRRAAVPRPQLAPAVPWLIPHGMQPFAQPIRHHRGLWHVQDLPRGNSALLERFLFAPHLPCLPSMFHLGDTLGISTLQRFDCFLDRTPLGWPCPSFPWLAHVPGDGALQTRIGEFVCRLAHRLRQGVARGPVDLRVQVTGLKAVSRTAGPAGPHPRNESPDAACLVPCDQMGSSDTRIATCCQVVSSVHQAPALGSAAPRLRR